MTKLNLTPEVIQRFKETGTLDVGADGSYILEKELAPIPKMNRIMESYTLRHVPDNSLHKLVITTKYNNKHDYKGSVHSVFIIPLSASETKKMEHDKTKRMTTPETFKWRNMLKKVKEVL